MKRALLIAATLLGACSGSPAPSALSGGATTVFDATSGAYANAAPNLDDARLDLFNLGHAIFTQNWVTAPASSNQQGLGPLFNQRSCSSCHSHDGRSPPFDQNGALLGMLFRLSVPGSDEHGGPQGDAVYGLQLHPNAILNVPAEGTPHVGYTEQPGSYGDGSTFSLASPTLSVTDWGYGAPAATLMMSPRVGPADIGLGLLEAVPESEILALVHQNDPDGIVGKPNYVWSVAANAAALGRFGWKANQPSVQQQTAGALNGDIGITSSLFPTKTCTATMTACNAAPLGDVIPDIDDSNLAALVMYMQTLAVPARRNIDNPSVQHGEALFTSFGCAGCHAPTLTTGVLDGVPEVSNQTIHPFTDLLLHDMGPALADGRPDYLASGSDWRTPPLWGIGLLQVVNGHTQLLHDGRARGLAEAILWHGGEAEKARERFVLATAGDRDDLILFLQSL